MDCITTPLQPKQQTNFFTPRFQQNQVSCSISNKPNGNLSLLTHHFSLISPPRGAKKHLTNAKGLEFSKPFLNFFTTALQPKQKTNFSAPSQQNQLFFSISTNQTATHHFSLISPPRGAKKHQLPTKQPLQIAMTLSILYKSSGRFNSVHLNIYRFGILNHLVCSAMG